MHNYIALLINKIRQSQWTPITESPCYSVLDKEGFKGDASICVVEAPVMRNVTSASGGWEAHLFVQVAGATWSKGTLQLVATKRLSISSLELITTTAAVALLRWTRKIPDEQKVVWWCVKTSACTVANTEEAYSSAMRFALKTFVHICEGHSVTVRLIYISSSENIIADSNRRNKWREALSRVVEKE